MRIPRAIVFSAAVVAITTCLFAATSASASLGHKYLYAMTSASRTNVNGVAVDSAGDAYLALNTGVVEKFDPSGKPVAFVANEPYIEGALLTGTGEQGGAFGNVRSVAVDQATGNIYVAAYTGETDNSKSGIYVFNESGEYQFAITEIPVSASVSGLISRPNALAINQATQEIYLIEENGSNVVDVFNAAGAYQSQIELGNEYELYSGLAVDDSTGRIYVGAFYINGQERRREILLVSHGGILESVWPQAPPGSEYGNGFLAVDSNNHHIYLDHSVGNTEQVLEEFSDSAEPLTQLLTVEGRKLDAQVVTVDSATDDLYVAEGNNVYVFGPDVVLPTVTAEAAEKVIATGAMFRGAVNPDELVVDSCAFKYGLTVSYGLSAPCSVPPGAGDTDVSVSANVGELEPNATYHYQLEAANENGSNYTSDEIFTTPPARPAVVSESASLVGSQEALLGATVNPENSDTTYRFVYGATSAYGLSVPAANVDLGSGFGSVNVVKSLAGLQPGGTYHYAVVTTNQAGTTYGPDQTFTTVASPLPSVTTGGVVNLAQNGVVVSGTIDPDGVQTGYEFDLGTDTAYGTRVFGNAGSGDAPETFTASFPSLEPGTTYHYRLVAIGADGATYGADQSFTTPEFPTSLLSSPGTLALVAIPQITFPTAPSRSPAPKVKPKAKKKKVKPKTNRRAKGKGGKAKKSNRAGKRRKSNAARARRSVTKGGE